MPGGRHRQPLGKFRPGAVNYRIEAAAVLQDSLASWLKLAQSGALTMDDIEDPDVSGP